MPNEMNEEEIRAKSSDPSSLSEDELRFAIERDMLSPVQLLELGLAEPRQIQAVLRGEEVYDPSTMPYSGNYLNLTEDEVKLIEERRRQAEEAPTPEIKVSSAIEEEDEDEDLPPYSEWTNKELRAEIAQRNEGRDDSDKLPYGDNKEALVSTLEADDNAGQ
jgi:hypothetical protein